MSERSSQSPEWHWREFGGIGDSVAGNAATEGMGDSPMSTAQIVAREVIQNFSDAADEIRAAYPGHRPRIAFRFVNLTGADKESLVKRLSLRDLRDLHAPGLRTARMLDSLTETSCLGQLDDLDIPLPVLYIEETGTIGLRGDPISGSATSRWFMCLMSLAASFHDAQEGPSGGTYGYGKAAFQLGSRINCVLAYSQFGSHDSDSATRRLGGHFYLPRHREGDLELSGRADFGVLSRYKDVRVTRPLEDNLADVLADELGMTRSSEPSPDRLGTTFMLPDTPVDPKRLIEEIESNWWPALLSQFFEVEVIDFDGVSHSPRPLARPDLNLYITAWTAIRNGAAPDINNLLRVLRPVVVAGKRKKVGTICLVADNSTAFGVAEEASKVALIRQRKMVVDYARLYENKAPFVQGVLLSDPEIEPYVAASEPKAHDSWWVKGQASKVSQRWTADTQEVIQTLWDRTYQAVGEFRRTLKPPRTKNTGQLRRLSERLADLTKYRRRTAGPGPRPPQGGDGVSLELAGGITEWGDSGMRGRQPIKVRATRPMLIGANAVIRVELFVVEDEARAGELMAIEYLDLPKGAKLVNGEVHLRLTDTPQAFVAVSAWSDTPVRWTAEARVSAEPTAEVAGGAE